MYLNWEKKMDSLKIKHHLKHLEEKHQFLDEEVRHVESTHSNQMMVVDLKKKKLKLKDEIENLKNKLA